MNRKLSSKIALVAAVPLALGAVACEVEDPDDADLNGELDDGMDDDLDEDL